MQPARPSRCDLIDCLIDCRTVPTAEQKRSRPIGLPGRWRPSIRVLSNRSSGWKPSDRRFPLQNPPSPTAMLKLRAARLAVEAERADAEADCTVAQFELAGLAGSGDRKGPPAAGFHSLRRPPAACPLRRTLAPGRSGGWKRPFRNANRRSSIRRRRWSNPMHRGRRQRPISSPAGPPSSACSRESSFRPARLPLSCGL